MVRGSGLDEFLNLAYALHVGKVKRTIALSPELWDAVTGVFATMAIYEAEGPGSGEFFMGAPIKKDPALPGLEFRLVPKLSDVLTPGDGEAMLH